MEKMSVGKSDEKMIMIKSFKQLWSYCSLKEKIEQIFLILFTFFSSLAKIFPILILSIITDKITTGKVNILNSNMLNELTLFQTIILVFLITIGLWVIAMINCTLIENFGYKMQKKIHSVGLNYIFTPRRNLEYNISEGEVSYNIKTIADNMLNYYYILMWDILRNSSAVILLFISVFCIDYILGYICIIGTILISLIVFLRIKLEVKVNMKVEEKNGKIQNYIIKTIQNIPVIINYDSFKYEHEKLKGLNQELYIQNKRKLKISYFYWITMIAIEYIMQMLIIMCSILLQPGNDIDVALVILVSGYASQIASEMEYFGERFTTLQNISIKIYNLRKIIPTKKQEMNHHEIENCEKIKEMKINEIEIRNLEIVVGDKIKEYNCIFNNEDINVIAGISGSGKTTLINAILGFKEYNKGEIVLNKQIIIPSFYCMQEKISVIYQNEMLFEDTIQNNLLYPNKDITKKKMDFEKLVSRFKISHLLTREQYNNNLSKLSGGEKKKISLIRAMFKKSDVFIFDEPTNNLDEEAVCEFLDLIKELQDNNKMVIIISHDKRILESAEKILKIGL